MLIAVNAVRGGWSSTAVRLSLQNSTAIRNFYNHWAFDPDGSNEVQKSPEVPSRSAVVRWIVLHACPKESGNLEKQKTSTATESA